MTHKHALGLVSRRSTVNRKSNKQKRDAAQQEMKALSGFVGAFGSHFHRKKFLEALDSEGIVHSQVSFIPLLTVQVCAADEGAKACGWVCWGGVIDVS